MPKNKYYKGAIETLTRKVDHILKTNMDIMNFRSFSFDSAKAKKCNYFAQISFCRPQTMLLEGNVFIGVCLSAGG